MALIGKYLCYAMLALSLDLIWGYCGILSLGHGAFFALGGYAMGMYLMRQIGSRGVYGNPDLPDFMVFLNWTELPWYWYGFDWFGFAAIMVLFVPGMLAFLFGFFAFRSRVSGVHLSIITQALTFALMLAFFRNDMGFGGNNGLTDFKDILGFNLQSTGTRTALFVATCIALAVSLLLCLFITRSRLGTVMTAIRDAESRTRFLGYRVEMLQALRLHRVGLHRRPRRRALCAAGRHHQSERVRARQFDRGRDLGGDRRTRHAVRPDPRRGARQFRQELVHQRAARMSGSSRWAGFSSPSRCSCPRDWPACSSGVHRRTGKARCPPPSPKRRSRSWTSAANSILYLDDVSVSFDGFKALNALSLTIEPGEMRAVIGPNGAGKTTMMDVITGKTRPDTGDVLFAETRDLTRLDEAAIAQLGIGRKFQKPSVFEKLTVEENLSLALAGNRGVGEALFWRMSPREKIAARRTPRDHQARRRSANMLAARLSHGQKQWLEIGMLLAQEPKLLLVDEPVAGMTDAETETTASLLKSIAGERSIVVVEHDMSFVRELGVKVTVLHEGSVLAEGSLDHVSADDRVIEVYLGR